VPDRGILRLFWIQGMMNRKITLDLNWTFGNINSKGDSLAAFCTKSGRCSPLVRILSKQYVIDLNAPMSNDSKN